MTERTCQGCQHGHELFMAQRQPPAKEWRCFRPRTFRSGIVEHSLGVGTSCAFETDNFPERHRAPGDKCGPQRGHSRRHDGFNGRWDEMTKSEQQANGRLLRNYEPAALPVWDMATSAFSEAHFATFPPELVERCLKAGCPPKGRVLDPFGGAGTTGLVADRLGLDCDLIELNPDYSDIAKRRLEKDAGMFSSVTVAA